MQSLERQAATMIPEVMKLLKQINGKLDKLLKEKK